MSELDRWVRAAEKRNPKDYIQWTRKDFLKRMDSLKNAVIEIEKRNEKIKKNNQVAKLTKIAYNFLSDLKNDGLIEADGKLSFQNTEKAFQAGQSRQLAFKDFHLIENKDYKVAFKAFNSFYAANYESFISSYLAPIYKKQFGREASKGNMLNYFKQYRKGKYLPLLAILVPQIRNSINHQNFLIDHKQPLITFYDRKKKPLTLSLDECKILHHGIFHLIIAFDIAVFDLQKHLLKEIAEAASKVNAFIKRYDLKLVRKKGGTVNIFELGKRLEEANF